MFSKALYCKKGHKAKFIEAMVIRRVRKSVRYDVLSSEAVKYHNHGYVVALKQRYLELNVAQVQYL